MKTTVFALTLSMIVLGSSFKGLCQSNSNPKATGTDINRPVNNNQRVLDASSPYDSPIVFPANQYPKERDSIRQFKDETYKTISKLDKDIAALKLKIANGTEATKDEYQKALAGMENQSQALKVKLDNFKYRENMKWHDFKNDMNRDLDNLGKAISDLGKKNTK